MPAEQRDFCAPIEGLLYMDSSFVIAYQTEEDPRHAECVAFWRRVEEAAILRVVSDFVFEEVLFHRLRAALSEAARPLRLSWREALRRHPALFDTAMAAADPLWEEIDALTITLPVLETVRLRAIDLMRQFRLLPADAYHIAVALEHDVTSFVSLDADFLQVAGITVYTCIRS